MQKPARARVFARPTYFAAGRFLRRFGPTRQSAAARVRRFAFTLDSRCEGPNRSGRYTARITARLDRERSLRARGVFVFRDGCAAVWRRRANGSDWIGPRESLRNV